MPKNQSGHRRKGAPRRERRLSIRSELRAHPDLHKIAGAVIALALAQAEKEAQEQAETPRKETTDEQ